MFGKKRYLEKISELNSVVVGLRNRIMTIDRDNELENKRNMASLFCRINELEGVIKEGSKENDKLNSVVVSLKEQLNDVPRLYSRRIGNLKELMKDEIAEHEAVVSNFLREFGFGKENEVGFCEGCKYYKGQRWCIKGMRTHKLIDRKFCKHKEVVSL